MKITKRDLEILRFINELGFCNRMHIEKRFNIKWWRVYKVMSRLIEAQLVRHSRVLHEQPGIYYLTKEGASYTDLPAIEKIHMGNYAHQLALTNVIIKLGHLYPEAEWISERQLKYEKFSDGIGKRGHVADGMLVYPDNKRVSIEVELTLKNNTRLKKIIQGYTSQLVIQEAWYFCSKNILSKLSELAAKKTFIKIHSLEEFLHE